MPATLAAPPADTSFRGVRRLLAAALAPGAVPGDGAPLLEIAPAGPLDPPRLIAAEALEGASVTARAVAGDPVVAFDAFLDGTQRSLVAAYLGAGVPVVHGTVAAVVRERRDRRMRTWRHVVRQALYAPRRELSAEEWSALEATDVPLVDTSDDSHGDGASAHPFALRETAVHRVQEHREAAERQLAAAWCTSGNGTLFVDGGIGAVDVPPGARVVGVVKTHRTLYVEGSALRGVLALRRAERSTAFLVTSPRRAPVASWYLRLRDPATHDPMWGLVRIEVPAGEAGDAGHLTTFADDVSRWVLAEVAPLALPDARWDRMVYGIRDCEEFLKAVQA